MKTFRLYFNRHAEAPQVWSIDEGDQSSEVNVIDFYLSFGVTAQGKYDPQPKSERSNVPSALMLVHADGYQIRHGVAEFYCGSPC
jgi:hypothetical protein